MKPGMRIATLLPRSKAWAAEGEAQCSPGWLITVFGVRGGAGVTTLAINLAVGLRRMWNVEVPRVELDLESRPDALMLNLKPKHSWTDLIKHRDALELGAAGGASANVSPV